MRSGKTRRGCGVDIGTLTVSEGSDSQRGAYTRPVGSGKTLRGCGVDIGTLTVSVR